MKKIESYEFRCGWGSENETTQKVNEKLAELANNKITNVDVNITGTGKGVMYTLVWNE